MKIKIPQLLIMILIAYLAFIFQIPSGLNVYANDNIVIICNKNISEIKINKKEIIEIFTGRKRHWVNGQKIFLATLTRKNSIHKDFIKTHIKKTPSQFNTFWKRKLFNGEAYLPKAFHTQQELIQYISDTDGAIGYISANSQNTDKIKILIIQQ